MTATCDAGMKNDSFGRRGGEGRRKRPSGKSKGKMKGMRNGESDTKTQLDFVEQRPLAFNESALREIKVLLTMDNGCTLRKKN